MNEVWLLIIALGLSGGANILMAVLLFKAVRRVRILEDAYTGLASK